MTALGLANFAEFFGELHRDADGNPCDPFPWQQKLMERILTSTDPQKAWPDALALPTASGKTACIDIALFALACQPHQPRRIFFVVDRRVIVDEAFQHASVVARKLAAARDGILHRIAQQLRTLAGLDDDESPVACHELRGGIYRDDAWAKLPTQPTIIASTVDQIGSRLLYRGYGVSRWSWPIHAGLVANDSLIILDEAHCAQPFMETLHAVQRYRQWGKSPLPGSFKAVLLSATPPSGITDVQRAEQADFVHSVLGPRLSAAKPTQLDVAAGDKFAKKLTEHALDLVADAQPKAVAILVNRVTTARQTYELLLKAKRGDVVLLTGRMRPIDRDKVVEQWLQTLRADSSGNRRLDSHVFVVATQCLEVGANLDFDAMVSECASLDALRQRFGRLNRAGRTIEANGVIVIRADQTKPEKEAQDQDPIYGNALPETWAWLKSLPNVDMGITALTPRIEAAIIASNDFLTKVQAPSPHAPIMLPAHVDCWVQTAPEPCPTPDVSIFLHGPQRGAPEVQVCWRSDLAPDESDEEAWIETVTLCPPASAECMPVPLYVVRRWMQGRTAAETLADVEGIQQTVEAEEESSTPARVVLRWRGPEDAKLVRETSDIWPGDLLVIPASLRGWEVFGHVPDTGCIDVGDEAHLKARALPVLRLHPQVMATWPACQAKDALLAIANASDLQDRLGETEFISELRGHLQTLSVESAIPAWLRDAGEALTRERRLEKCLSPYPAGGLVLRATKRLAKYTRRSETFADQDRTSSATVAVALASHSKSVAERVYRLALRSGLTPLLAEDLRLAGWLHDLGKADPRFQRLLRNGNPVVPPLLAKSDAIPLTGRAYRALADRMGFPEGGRHELLSVRLAESAIALLQQAHDRDIVLHLIASHHGRCRPFAPVIEDQKPQAVNLQFDGHSMEANSDTTLERLDSGVGERFWHLVRRYGWWGVAYLEAILRLADHRQSEAEQQQKEILA